MLRRFRSIYKLSTSQSLIPLNSGTNTQSDPLHLIRSANFRFAPRIRLESFRFWHVRFQESIHILALTTLDIAYIGILRLVEDDPDATRELLSSHGIAFSEGPILAMEIAGERDGEGVSMALLEAEVNIHYMYSFISRPMGRSALAMSIDDLDIVMDILRARNHKVLSQHDISR